jgi:translation initiation factor 4G
MSESKKQLDANAKIFVPGQGFVSASTATTAPTTTPSTKSNSNNYNNSHNYSGQMSSSAASFTPSGMQQNTFQPQFYQGYPMYQQPQMMFTDQYGHYPNYPNMNAPQYNPYNNQTHHHSKKNNYHHNHHNHNNNNSNGVDKSTTEKSKTLDTKSSNKADDKDTDLDEPHISFGDIDEPPSPATEQVSTNGEKNVNSLDTTKEIEVVEEKTEDKQKIEEVNIDIKFDIGTDSTVETQGIEKSTSVESTTSPKESPAKDTTGGQRELFGNDTQKNVDWKRNVSVVEKTAAQMLLRNDGVTRYGKSELCSMNSSNKTCPEDIRAMYLHLAQIERVPMSETVRQKSPSNNNRQGGRNRNKHNQAPEAPHPDEKKLFSTEHLKSSALFGGGRPDKVVDVTTHEGIVSQANFILNVMTIETFDKMSDKFMTIGLESEELMKIGVDLIVSKAQLEEHFSFMYADLCKKITDQWVTADGKEGVLGEQFRRFLLTRCQEEFRQDRDAAVKAVLDLNLEKEDEDEKLLILKKRYTGHMRFVGELYVKDMIKAKTMNSCIVELLDSTNEEGKREDEKLACLCKLFQTVGKKLEDYETKKKRTTVQEYFNKISSLASDKTLSSKVRFGFKDLIEMRENNWVARRVEEKAKKLSEIRKEDRTQGTPKSLSATPRGGSKFQDTGSQDVRRSSPALEQDEWQTIPTSSKGRKGNKGSLSTPSSPSPRADSSNNNKFSALNNAKNGTKGVSAIKKTVPGKIAKEDKSEIKRTESPQPNEESIALLPGHDGEVDENTLKRINAAFNEYYGNDMVDEIVEVLKELVHVNGMWKALHSTMRSVMGFSTPCREKYTVLLPKLYEQKVLTREQTVKGISSFLHEFDDFVIDVPLLAGYFSNIMAHLFVNDVFEGDVRFITTLPEENDFTISYRMMSVIVQAAVYVKDLSDEEKAISFFTSAVDITSIDKMQKDQLTEAIDKHGGQFLPYQA